MMFAKRFLLSFLLLASSTCLFCQENYPQDYFASPMNIPLGVSGYFAELRGEHFHSGIDLKTGGKEGQAVICPAQGEVSRIKIQAYGGGKNLYISHPNGYTTVYMHLSRYCDKIEAFVSQYQNKNKTYEFDTKVPLGDIVFNQGDTIAFSGNTGASGGPHLHYEIRNTKTEHTINPQLFGLSIQDTIAPKIYNIEIVPWGKGSKVEFSDSRKIFCVSENNKSPYPHLCEGDTVRVTGSVYLGVLAFDKMITDVERNGVYSYKVFLDDSLFWQLKIDEFSFVATRYTNACIDYQLYKQSASRFLITRLLPNNLFPSFKTYQDNGIISVAKGQLCHVKYLLEDFAGNKTQFSFFLQGKPYYTIAGNFYQEDTSEQMQYCSWEEEKTLRCAQASAIIPSAALYEDAWVGCSYWQDTITKRGVYSFASDNALQKSMKIMLPIDTSLLNNEALQGKLLVLQRQKGYFYSIGGVSKDGFICAYSKDFGDFKVGFDTIKPQILPLNFKANKTIKASQQTLRIKITDNLSGIRHYALYLNDKWVLAEYDGKKKTIIYHINPIDLNEGENILRVTLTDKCSNNAEQRYNLRFADR
jgi:Membrane proteins related to metalloendopeptidases